MNDLTLPPALETPTRIGAEERARRKAAIDYARGSMRLEGFVLDAATEEMNRRYISGEITSTEHSDAIRASLGL